MTGLPGLSCLLLFFAPSAQRNVGPDADYLYFEAYAACFEVGNYVSMAIESKLALGTLVVRAVLSWEGKCLVDHLREAGCFGVTYVDVQRANGPVLTVYTIVMRKELERVTDIMEGTVPKSFFTVEELWSVQEDIFPVQPAVHGQNFLGRKSK